MACSMFGEWIMNYSELSDFEINKLVAEKLGQDLSGVNQANQFNYNILGYCTNPYYAWHVILDNGISSTPYGKEWMAWSDKTQVRSFSHNVNPLRAAMEVFLMTGDAA